MNLNNNSSSQIFTSISHHICLIALLLAFIPGCTRQITKSIAQKGFTDLTGIPVNKTIRLDGEWEFYWNKLLTPQQIRNSDDHQYLNIPGSWAGKFIDGAELNGSGFATFRLRVRVAENSGYFLKIYSIHSAYRLWINGTLKDSSGIVASSAKTMKPRRSPSVIELPSGNREYEIVLQISNYHYRAGGINTPVILGQSSYFIKAENKQAAIEYFLAGAILIMALYHLMMFFVYRNDKASLFFGLFCVLSFMRMLVTGEIFSASMYGMDNYRVNIQIEYLTVYIPVILFILYSAQLFPQEVKGITLKLSVAVGSLLSIITIITPTYFFTHLMPVYHPILLIQFIWLLSAISLSAVRHRQGALLMFLGFVFIFCTTLYDMAFTWKPIEGKYVLPAGIFIFLVTQTYMLSKRFAFAYKTIEAISGELSTKNDQLVRLSKLKDDFLARVTHELRTPLYGIIGTAEMLLEKNKQVSNRFTQNSLKIITTSARRLSRLVNDILDFSKMKNGEIMLFKKSVDLYSLTQNAVILLESAAKEKNIRIENQIDKECIRVVADEDKLQQILYNLLGNSIKFTHEGKIVISATQISGEMLKISITDTGIGIAENKLDVIFDSFEQVEDSDSRQYEGSGLGLSITKHLVELHGGTIEILSRIGQGTTVNITLPVAENNKLIDQHEIMIINKDIIAAEISEISHNTEVRIRDGSQNTLLIVDDDPVSVKLIADALDSIDCSIKTASDGESALEMINSGDVPDVIIMDMMMPKMSGLQCTRILRQKYNPSQLPIIMLTARNLLSDLMHSFESGANDFLTKPFLRSELLLRVKTQFELKKIYTILRENLKLQKELKMRRKKENELLVLQKKLSYMLDMVEDAIVALDEDSFICYMNKQSEKLLELSAATLIGQELSSLLDGKYPEISEYCGSAPKESRIFPKIKFEKGSGKITPLDITITSYEYEEGNLSILILRHSDGSSGKDVYRHINQVHVPSFISELSKNTERFRMFQDTLSRLNPDMFENNPQLKADLCSIDDTLLKLQNYFNPEIGRIDKRIYAVQLLKKAVDLWCKHTNHKKPDLAEKSGLWNVQVNADGWRRTQTLDKYLDIDTIPKNPKWKAIEETVEYVYDYLDEGMDGKTELEEMLNTFRTMN